MHTQTTERRWREMSAAECRDALREAVQSAQRRVRLGPCSRLDAGRPMWHYPAPAPSRPAPARRQSSPVVRAAGPITAVHSKRGSPGTIAGYAALFNKPSVDLGGYVEFLAPGAFRSTLARVARRQHDVLALSEHDHKSLLGRLSAGNLTLQEDNVGLRFTLELPDTQLGRDVRELVGRGILRGMSFSFAVIRDEWGRDGDNKRRRTVHDMTMFEISTVGSPAYPFTSVVATRSGKALRDAAFWSAARLRAVSARPTRGAAALALSRSTATREWR